MKFPFFKVNIILMVNQHDEWRRDRAYLRKKIWRQRRNVFMWRNVTFDHRRTIRHAPFWVWCLREFGKIMIQFQNNEKQYEDTSTLSRKNSSTNKLRFFKSFRSRLVGKENGKSYFWFVETDVQGLHCYWTTFQVMSGWKVSWLTG